MKVSIFVDRYRLQVQEKRERNNGERTLVDLNWGSIVPNLRRMKGKSWKIRNGRHMAVVSAWKISSHDPNYAVLEAGIFTPGRKPAQWKRGEEEVKLVELADGHEWIHPSWIVFPLVGNQLVLQATRNGPHIGDISWWIKNIIKCNYVDATYVPCGNFYDGLGGNKKWKKIILQLNRKVRAIGQEATYLESELGEDIGAGKISITYEPGDGRGFTLQKVKDAISRYVPGLTTGEGPLEKDPYEIDDCALVPLVDDNNPSDVLSFVNGIRRQIIVETTRDRVITRSQIESGLAAELKAWIGTP